MPTTTSKSSVAPSRNEFKFLILEFVNDFTYGRYDTIKKLKQIDDVTSRFPQLQSLKKEIMKEIIDSPVRCNPDSLNEFQLYCNDYSDGAILPLPIPKRKRMNKKI